MQGVIYAMNDAGNSGRTQGGQGNTRVNSGRGGGGGRGAGGGGRGGNFGGSATLQQQGNPLPTVVTVPGPQGGQGGSGGGGGRGGGRPQSAVNAQFLGAPSYQNQAPQGQSYEQGNGNGRKRGRGGRGGNGGYGEEGGRPASAANTFGGQFQAQPQYQQFSADQYQPGYQAEGRGQGGRGDGQNRRPRGEGRGEGRGDGRGGRGGAQQQSQQPRAQTAGGRPGGGRPASAAPAVQHVAPAHVAAAPAHAHHEGHHHAHGHHAEPIVLPDQAPIPATFLSTTPFTSYPLHANSQKALKDGFKYAFPSAPQALYLDKALQGMDVFVKAKTGSGKTLGFLLPSIEHVARAQGSRGISVLVLSPTRELAEQTRREAERLLQFHPGRSVMISVGGNNVNGERKRLMSANIDILVATPGRLQDHLQSEPGFRAKLQGLKVLVLDEADRLLDMGFLPDIKRIAAFLPPPAMRAQTLLLTATVPQGVQEVAKAFLKPGYSYVDTVGKDEPASHEHIEQEYLSVPTRALPSVLYEVLRRRREAAAQYRIIVFFPTARMAQFAAALFRASGMPDVLELHSRLSQGQRNTTTARFASEARSTLFASDVIARGMDFPDVSLVVQVGLTDATQYEHRVGRTGRVGKIGEGLLLICNDEERMLDDIFKRGLQLTKTSASSTVTLGVTAESVTAPPPGLAQGMSRVLRDADLKSSSEKAFVATLGFYASNTRKLGWTMDGLIVNVKERFKGMGVMEGPEIEKKTLGKMNLKNIYRPGP